MLTASCGYSISDSAMEEGLVPDAVSQFYDNENRIIYTTASAEHRLPVKLEKIPKHVRAAFVSIEDNRFYEHSGIDYRGTFRALVSNIMGQEVQGGSTITQQLAKNAFLTQERTIKRKIKEAFLARQMENKYTKDEILNMYLNQIYFGEGAYGVESASLTYFGKHVQDITLAEAATLAAIPKSPNYFDPMENPKANKERRDIVLDQMVKYGHITQADAQKAKAEEVKIRKEDNTGKQKDLRSYFFDYISQQIIDKYGADALFKGGLKVYTTLDSSMQAKAEHAIRYLPDIWTEDPDHLTQPQAGLVALDPTTGYIKAMVGGRGQDKFNRAVLAQRQPGSAFKAFVYLTAMDNGLTAATMVDDKPLQIGGWAPQNSGGGFHGTVTLRTALSRSYNIPAIRVALRVGTDKVMRMAKACGITSLVEDGPYTDNNPAMALGGLTKGVSPLDMAVAYGTIANNGVLNQPVSIIKILDRNGKTIFEHKPAPKQVVSAKAAYQTTDMLKDVLISGTAGGSGIGRPAAGKTGTTDDSKDAWFCGYTPNLSCAVWVGDDRNRSMGAMYGSGAPLSIWHDFMVNAIQEVPYADFTRPAGAVTPVGKDIGKEEDKDKNKEEETKLQNDPLAKPPKIVKPKSKNSEKPVVSNKPEKKSGSTLSKPAPVKPAPTKPAPAKPTPVKPQQKADKK
ncbi:MAG: PBP1A family penicillin-binding protein [Acidaminococcaceae bacterium]|nr:PBP1A family penicillin-binding protein [Acidaminococcaceae bacterium]